jgi:ribosomal protein L22
VPTAVEKQEVRAEAKWVRVSPRKARLVVEHIRGRSVPEARTVLAFTQRAAARRSRRCCARRSRTPRRTRPELERRRARRLAVYVDEGPTIKRWRARARGRVARIRKRTCHITIKLARPRGARHDRRAEQPAEARTAKRAPGRHAQEEGGDRVVGQKVHPGGMRVGVIHDWKSNWWTGKKEFPAYLIEDIRIPRAHLQEALACGPVRHPDPQGQAADHGRHLHGAPGIVIGKSGVEVDALRKELHAITGKNVHININEIKRPELDAKLVAQSIASSCRTVCRSGAR